MHDAGIVTRHPETLFEIEIPYDMLGKLEHVIGERQEIRIVDTRYAADVTLALAARTAALEDVREVLGGILQRNPSTIAAEES